MDINLIHVSGTQHIKNSLLNGYWLAILASRLKIAGLPGQYISNEKIS